MLKWREIALDYLKDAVDVDPEVLVGDEVAESGDIGPWDIGRRFARLLREVLDGLSYDHELKEKRIVKQRVFPVC